MYGPRPSMTQISTPPSESTPWPRFRSSPLPHVGCAAQRRGPRLKPSKVRGPCDQVFASRGPSVGSRPGNRLLRAFPLSVSHTPGGTPGEIELQTAQPRHRHAIWRLVRAASGCRGPNRPLPYGLPQRNRPAPRRPASSKMRSGAHRRGEPQSPAFSAFPLSFFPSGRVACAIRQTERAVALDFIRDPRGEGAGPEHCAGAQPCSSCGNQQKVVPSRARPRDKAGRACSSRRADQQVRRTSARRARSTRSSPPPRRKVARGGLADFPATTVRHEALGNEATGWALNGPWHAFAVRRTRCCGHSHATRFDVAAGARA